MAAVLGSPEAATLAILRMAVHRASIRPDRRAAYIRSVDVARLRGIAFRVLRGIALGVQCGVGFGIQGGIDPGVRGGIATATTVHVGTRRPVPGHVAGGYVERRFDRGIRNRHGIERHSAIG
jgi:hypothetical protein